MALASVDGGCCVRTTPQRAVESERGVSHRLRRASISASPARPERWSCRLGKACACGPWPAGAPGMDATWHGESAVRRSLAIIYDAGEGLILITQPAPPCCSPPPAAALLGCSGRPGCCCEERCVLGPRHGGLSRILLPTPTPALSATAGPPGRRSPQTSAVRRCWRAALTGPVRRCATNSAQPNLACKLCRADYLRLPLPASQPPDLTLPHSCTSRAPVVIWC